MQNLILSLVISVGFFFNNVTAQLSIEQVEKSSRLGISSEYTSNVNFQGRKIGNNQFGVNAGLNYVTASGFGLHYTADYWSGFATSGISQHTVGLSYEFDLSSWLEVSLGYERWFLNTGNDTLNSDLNNYFTFGMVADADFVKPHFSANFIKGSENAYGFEIGIGAPISIIDNEKSRLSVTPDIALMSGTDTRLTTLLIKRARGKSTVSTSSQSIFGLLNTELTLPITYTQPLFEITAAAHLAIPHSLSANDVVNDAFVYYTLNFNYFIFVAK